MSKFSTVIDAVRTRVALLTGFAAKTELPNPYSLGDNIEGSLRDGWAVAVGQAGPGATEFGSLVDVHEIVVILTREVVSTANDPTAIVTAIKLLKDDAKTLQTSLEGGGVLNLPNDLENFSYSGTSSVEFGDEGDRNKWVTISLSFLASIREDLA